MVNHLKNLKFRSKLIISYIVISILPIMILGMYSYTQSREYIANKTRQSLITTVNQMSANVDLKIQRCNLTVDSIVTNPSLRRILNTTYTSYFSMHQDYTQILDPLINSLLFVNDDIMKMTFYIENDQTSWGRTIQPIRSVEDAFWYDKAIHSFSNSWFTNGDTMFCAQSISTYPGQKVKKLVRIDVDKQRIFKAFEQDIGFPLGIIVFDENDHSVIYNQNPFDHYVEASEIIGCTGDQINLNSKIYAIINSKIEHSDMEVISYLPMSMLTINTKEIMRVTLLIVGICVLLMILITLVFSSAFVKRIYNLNEKMTQVIEGDLNVAMTSQSNDEIGQLSHKFGQLMSRIHHLIDENVKSNMIKKEAELNLKQARIKPHFLYNTLSLINWKAKLIEEEEISKLAIYLSRYYRATLNKGKNMTLVKDELENVKAYIEIQRIVHENKFIVIYDVDESILNEPMINLVLQPVVENAIEHGILNKRWGVGEIKIKIMKDQDFMILSVIDNGIGIEKDILDKLLVTGDIGYGIRNVHERIKLQYGEEYGLSIVSNGKNGTSVKIELPIVR